MHRNLNKRFFQPAMIVLIYVLVAGVWIVFSDSIVAQLAPSSHLRTTLQSLKGLFFVAGTGILLYVLIRGYAESLRQKERHNRLTQRAAKACSWDWDIEADRFTWAGDLSSFLTEGDGTSPLPRTYQDVIRHIHPEDIPNFERAVQESLLRDQELHLEFRWQRGANTRWFFAVGEVERDLTTNKPQHLRGIIRDITQRKQAEQELAYKSEWDGLTGLLNRSFFLKRLEQLFQTQRRLGHCSFAVLLLDIDRFSRINDSLGHWVGDAVLQETSRRLANFLSPADSLARLSADEFGILLQASSDQDQVLRSAQHILEVLKTPMHLSPHDINITASIGVVTCFDANPYNNPEYILRDAATAMRQAKLQGGDQIAAFKKALHTQAFEALSLENQLRKNLRDPAQQELFLAFQPIVDLGSGEIAGFEALIRWRLADGTVIPPNRFIPVAEQSGLIQPLGKWVLDSACAALAALRANDPNAVDHMHVNVNVSARQLEQHDFVREINELLLIHNLPAQTLRLELTETVLMENAAQVQNFLGQLQEIGIGVAVDDFGTGYSSLSYLHRFSINTLKIDLSFVQSVLTNEHSKAITQAIIDMAQSLNKTVVAEGIETQEQATLIAAMGCRYAQGFLFSYPLEKEALPQLLDQQPLVPTPRE